MKKIKYILLSVLTFSFMACENEELQELRDNANQEEVAVNLPELTAGTADFSSFVSVGASFTAGFTDNALFIASQENSFPNIMATQFAKIGGGNFNQPLMNDNFGGLAANGNRIIDPRLVFGGAGPVPLETVIGPVTVTTDIVLNNPSGPFNNFGVPGAKSFDMNDPFYAAANPYATRLLGSSGKSMVELAADQNPTFFTLSEIGGNDVLGYATSGGDGSNPITDTATFDTALNDLVTSLTANGANGAIGNLPNITSLSFFTTVDYNPVPLDAATADFLNSAQGYGAYNAGIVQAYAFLVATTPLTQAEADAEIAQRTITFAAGEGNAVVIVDEDLRDLTGINIQLQNFRQATSDDLVLLTAGSLIPQGAGTATPLSDTFVLTPQEQQEIATATDAYNASISAVANANGLALVDLNSILEQASTMGIQFDQYSLNTDLVFGGLVSLDGVHLTARGYALMANSFLAAIDETYGSNFVASGNVAKAEDFPLNYSPLLQ